MWRTREKKRKTHYQTSLTLKISAIPIDCYNGYGKNIVKSGIKITDF